MLIKWDYLEKEVYMFACISRKTSISGVLLLLLMPISSNAIASGFEKATEVAT